MFKVFINPGHWPHPGDHYDPGAVNPRVMGPDGKLLKEGVMVRVVAEKLEKRLNALLPGVKVIRAGSPLLKDTVTRANAENSDLFISLHFNALNGKAKGVEVFTYRYGSADSKLLAHKIYNEIRWTQRNYKRTPFYWRGEKTAGFYVLKYTNMPSVLVEMAFIDNDEEAKEILTLEWQNKMVEALAQGIKKYIEQKEGN